MKGYKRFALMTLCLFYVCLSRADIGKLYTSGKLSSTLIECMCQDKYGYLWIGTEYGLNKFDGYRFSTYIYDKNDTTSIVDNEVVKVLCDNEGRLWVGCSSGLARYDYNSNRFVRYTFPDKTHPRVNALQQISNGDIFIGTAGYGLYSILGTIALRRYSPYTVTAYTFLFAAAGSWVICNPGDMISKFSAAPDPAFLLLFCCLTALVTAVIPFLAYTLGLQTVEASKAGIIATVEPMVATLIGIVFFSEPITLLSGLGILLILGAVILLNWKSGQSA